MGNNSSDLSGLEEINYFQPVWLERGNSANYFNFIQYNSIRVEDDFLTTSQAN
eukprot:m.93474 g.93474  ORF g.93474 m.93474 type:complete len:53 (+) comp21785_c0_seq1:131-289(+)